MESNPAYSGLLSATLDQLHAFTAVGQAKSISRASEMLGRASTSIVKQLDAFQRHMSGVTQEPLFYRTDSEIQFTNAGLTALEMGEAVFATLESKCRDLKQKSGSRDVSIATSSYGMESFIAVRQHIDRVSAELRMPVPAFKFINVRSSLVQQLVTTRSADFGFTDTFSSPSGIHGVDRQLEFMPFQTFELVLLSNYPINQPSFTLQALRDEQVPLILPRRGAIKELLDFHFKRSDAHELFTVSLLFEDILFANSYLKSQVTNCGIIYRSDIAPLAQSGAERMGVQLYKIPIITEYRLHAGAFVLKGLTKQVGANHPAILFSDLLRAAWHKSGVHAASPAENDVSGN
jgi:DNA-binding transcriptional LysR family regulator